MGDGDLSVIAHYLSRGHTLDEMVKLSPTEKAFYRAAWLVEMEYFGEIVKAILGGKGE